ncbi:MAG TPA: C-type lectin domain-containing protein [Myxococcota bacterium]|nr:C-type lectin domain-containing protein [Myxococcota bacterium]
MLTRSVSAASSALLAFSFGLSSSPAFASTYALTPVLSWTDAEAYATSLGGHLVVIDDQAEQDALVAQFGGTEPFWIGLTDTQIEGTFMWVNGDPLTYTNWLPGEPNNSGGVENYGEMNWGAPGKWNDATNEPGGRGIVEFPEPAAGAGLALAAVALGGCSLIRRRGWL